MQRKNKRQLDVITKEILWLAIVQIVLILFFFDFAVPKRRSRYK